MLPFPSPHMYIYVYTYIIEYYTATFFIKKDEIWPFGTGILPSEISQVENDRYYILSLSCGI